MKAKLPFVTIALGLTAFMAEGSPKVGPGVPDRPGALITPADGMTETAAELDKLVAESKQRGHLFGLDDPTGMIGVHSLELATIPDSLDKADVPGHLVFPSPDGRYAINHPTTEQAAESDYEVENHLVSLKTMKSVLVIPNRNGGDFERRNHGGLRVQWRPDSRAALVLGDGKWEPSTFCALVLDADDKPRAIDLITPVYEAIIARMKDRWPEIRKGLDLSDDMVVQGDNIPWSLEYVRYGAEFTPDGKSVRVIAEFETNGKRMEGQVVARANAEGLCNLADGSFHLISAHVSDAGVVSYNNDTGEEVLNPKIVFPNDRPE